MAWVPAINFLIYFSATMTRSIGIFEDILDLIPENLSAERAAAYELALKQMPEWRREHPLYRDQIQGIWSADPVGTPSYRTEWGDRGAHLPIAEYGGLPAPDNIDIGPLVPKGLFYFEQATVNMSTRLHEFFYEANGVEVVDHEGYVKPDSQLFAELPKLEHSLKLAREQGTMPKDFMVGHGAGGLLGLYTGCIAIGETVPRSPNWLSDYYLQQTSSLQPRAADEAEEDPDSLIEQQSRELPAPLLSKRSTEASWVWGVKALHAIIFRLDADFVSADQARWFQGVTIVTRGNGDAWFQSQHWSGLGKIAVDEGHLLQGIKYGHFTVTIPGQSIPVSGHWMASGRAHNFLRDWSLNRPSAIRAMFSSMFYTVQLIRQQARHR